MEGNLYAVVMLLMLAGSIAVVKMAGQRPRLHSVMVGVLLVPLVFFVVALLPPSHACRRGQLMNPGALSAVLAGVVAASVKPLLTKALTTVTLIAVGLILMFWGVELVHHDGYVGNRDWSQELDRMRAEPALKNAALAIQVASVRHPTAVLAEGWIEQSLKQAVGEYPFDSPPTYKSATVGHYWHTWLTGIYRLQDQQKGVWCKGGPIADCLTKLDTRERREPNHATSEPAPGAASTAHQG